MEDGNYIKPLSLDVIHRWDNAALTMLYRHFYKAMVAYAMQMVGGRNIAEDIVQETFYGSWKNKNTFKTIGMLKAYLFNAVRNESITYLRRQQVTQKHAIHVEQIYREMQTDDNGDLVQHKEELYRQLFMALDEMPEKHREVFLHIMEGKKNHEIAEAMQISVNTVKKIRLRGIEKMRKSLSPEAAALMMIIFA
jgi:RNA polymerase sigma-70 factor (ECF subfamily)